MTFKATDSMKKIDLLVSQLQRKDAKVGFFVGAGISTNCGIPDFRSPETGLYANLEKLNLPYPEAVFDIDYFAKSPKAFYTLAEELFPGRFVPSKFHYFIRLCQDKGILKRCYTQNIDTLERIAGVSSSKVIEAHGSFSANHCIICNQEMSHKDLISFMNDKKIPVCQAEECSGFVKPDIVFFGEALPQKMWDYWDEDIDDLDIAIVAGTSLAVHPFANLPAEVSKKVQRVLINKERCGDFSSRPRNSDIILLDDCDQIAQLLCDKLGWSEELETLLKEGQEKISKNLAKNELVLMEELYNSDSASCYESVSEAEDASESEESSFSEVEGEANEDPVTESTANLAEAISKLEIV